MTVFSQSLTFTCRLLQTYFSGDAFCICPTRHAYSVGLKHNNFICQLTSVSDIFPSYVPYEGSCQERLCTEKCYPPPFHMSPFSSLVSSLSSWSLKIRLTLGHEKPALNKETRTLHLLFSPLFLMLLVSCFLYSMLKYSFIGKKSTKSVGHL